MIAKALSPANVHVQQTIYQNLVFINHVTFVELDIEDFRHSGQIFGKLETDTKSQSK
jgi:hypothetical protein